MSEAAEELTAAEAHCCLDAIACAESEGWYREVGPTRPDLGEDGLEQLVSKLASIAGLDLEVVRRDLAPGL